MDFVRRAATAALGLAVIVVGSVPAMSADVKVMAGSALAGVIKELSPAFEQATGNKLAAQYGLGPRHELGHVRFLGALVSVSRRRRRGRGGRRGSDPLSGQLTPNPAAPDAPPEATLRLHPIRRHRPLLPSRGSRPSEPRRRR